jgi:hypothetical protein
VLADAAGEAARADAQRPTLALGAVGTADDLGVRERTLDDANSSDTMRITIRSRRPQP